MGWTYLNQTSSVMTSSGTTSAIDTTGADLIVVSVSQTETPVAVLSDSLSNTYTTLTPQQEPTPIATFNPSQTNSEIALTGGDLIATKTTTATNGIACCSSSFSTGLVYWETEIFFSASANAGVGIANTSSTFSINEWLGDVADSLGWYANGNVYNNGIQIATWATYTSGQTVAIALDLTHNMIWGRVGSSGNWNNSGSANPETNTGGVSLNSSIYTSPVVPAVSIYNITLPDSATANFGASSFVGTVPSGFTAVGGSVGGTRCQLFYCQGGASGTGHTFSLTAGSDFFGVIQVLAFNGSGDGALDTQNGASSSSTVTSISPGIVTPTFKDSLAVSCFTTGTTGPGNGSVGAFANQNAIAFDNGSNVGSAIGWQVLTDLNPFNGSWINDGGATSSVVVALFSPEYGQKVSVWTSTRTIEKSDQGSVIEYDSSSSGSILIPTDNTTYFQIGTKIEWYQKNSGLLTVTAVTPGTTTIRSTGSVESGQGASGFIRKRAVNDWVIGGYL